MLPSLGYSKRALLSVLSGTGFILTAILHSTVLIRPAKDGPIAMKGSGLWNGDAASGGNEGINVYEYLSAYGSISAFFSPQDEANRRAALTAVDSVIPLRTKEEMKQTQQCFRQMKGYGYLLHMRKAGGSTMRGLLNFMVEKRPNHLIYVTEGDTFNTSCFRHQGEFLTITSLRDPVDRIISSYWYEGRYPSETPMKSNDSTTKSDGSSGEEEEVVVSFGDYVETVRKQETERWDVFMMRRVWLSVDNYYIKTLTNRYRDNLGASITRQDFELAKRILASFDLVLITEWLGSTNQTAYMSEVLGQPIWNMGRRNENRRKKRMKEEKEVDGVIEHKLIEELRQVNYWDLLLYEYAKNLVTARMQAHAAPAEAKRGQQEGKGDVTAQKCRLPINDPKWRKDDQQPVDKANHGSYIYTRPQCIIGDLQQDLIREIW